MYIAKNELDPHKFTIVKNTPNMRSKGSYRDQLYENGETYRHQNNYTVAHITIL